MRRFLRSLVMALTLGWMLYQPVWWNGQWWTRMYWVEPLVAPTYIGVMPGYYAQW